MPTAKQISPTATKPKNAVSRFIGDTIAEMKKVTWLTRQEITYLTGLVLIISITVGIILGVIDFGFTKFIEKFLLNI